MNLQRYIVLAELFRREHKVAGNNLLREKNSGGMTLFFYRLLVLCISSVYERDVLMVERDVTKGKIHLLPRAYSIFFAHSAGD